MEKDKPWAVGSWSILKEGFTGVMAASLRDVRAEGGRGSDCIDEIIHVLKETFVKRSPTTLSKRKMVPRWQAWEASLKASMAEMLSAAGEQKDEPVIDLRPAR